MKFSNSLYLLSVAVLVCVSVSTGEKNKQTQKPRVHPYFATKCISESVKCGSYYAKYSRSCVVDRFYKKQPMACLKYACNWCTKFKKQSRILPCSHWRVRNVCKQLQHKKKKNNNNKDNKDKKDKYPSGKRPNSSKPTPSSPHKPANPGYRPPTSGNQCTWTGRDNNIVIDFGKVTPSGGWERCTRRGYKGIEFRRSPARGAISPKGKHGKICFSLRAPMGGSYYMTAVSYAPHPTEHNDVWVASSKGFILRKHGGRPRYIHPMQWTKAYQNNGKKGMSEHFKTVDHDGHRFIVPGLNKGEKFNVCIAGRSKKYELYHMVFVKCESVYCKGGVMTGKMIFGLKPSKCI